ncbi:hypothetical protein [Streptomyces venezuelae]|uniref:hypothetical protein n=1 Tax=Streptomyces venezuelae TaxID=54571 RepID=UPI0034417A07
MISSRLDRIIAHGTGPTLDRIHLADGQGIAIRAVPGADTADEVFVSPGVTIPDIQAREAVTRLDAWLAVGQLVERRCYLDVPVEAVRALITRHGGEHADQGPGWSIPAAEAQGSVPAETADLRARFEDGYSADDILIVFGRIHDAGGPYLVCVWDYADAFGFGGNSEFFAEDENGTLFEVAPDLHEWLSGQRATPGPADTWVCAPVAEPTEFPVSDDFHNYARTDRTYH